MSTISQSPWTAEELFRWVALLCKRSGMRSNPEKRARDLEDARNYLDALNSRANSDAEAVGAYLDAKALYDAVEAT